jgi:hypothetical protein
LTEGIFLFLGRQGLHVVRPQKALIYEYDSTQLEHKDVIPCKKSLPVFNFLGGQIRLANLTVFLARVFICAVEFHENLVVHDCFSFPLEFVAEAAVHRHRLRDNLLCVEGVGTHRFKLATSG